MTDVVVLGSLNMDIVISTERMPTVGETILGKEIDYLLGGKGANQAVAASRMGAQVSLLGKVGGDTFGEKVLQHLQNEKLDTTSIVTEENIFTGIATVFKLPEDNCITVVAGANDWVDEEYVKDIEEKIKVAKVLLVQLEIPCNAVKLALQIAKKYGVLTILNPAPYQEEVSGLLEWVDIITPNETEFASLMGDKGDRTMSLEQQMLDWSQQHKTKLVVTRGSMGTSFIENDRIETLPARKVSVVDTTGAGDTFNGILAVLLGKKKSMYEAVKYASIGASLSVRKLGAQTGMPYLEELKQAIKE